MVYHEQNYYKIKKLLKRIHQEHRKPTLYEYDILIDYYYPPNERENWRIESDILPKPTKRVLDHQIIHMFENDEAQKKWEKKHPFNSVVENVYREVELWNE